MSICRSDFSDEQASAIESIAKRLQITFAAAVRVILDRSLNASETLVKREQIASETLPSKGTIGVSSVSEDEHQTKEEAPKLTGRSRREVPKSEASPDFLAFWAVYPKKKSRGAALRRWETLRMSNKLPALAELLGAVERQHASAEWAKNAGEFIPHPATWLNGEQWLNDLGPPPPPAKKPYDPYEAKHRIWAKADAAKAAGLLSSTEWDAVVDASDDLPDREAATRVWNRIPEVPDGPPA